eukprot:UN06777
MLYSSFMVYDMSTPLFPLACIENEICHFQRRHEAFEQSNVKDIWDLKCKGHLIFKFTILYCIITTNILLCWRALFVFITSIIKVIFTLFLFINSLIKWIFALFLFIESLIKGIFIIKILYTFKIYNFDPCTQINKHMGYIPHR